MKKPFSVLCFLVLLFSITVAPAKATGSTFSDVPSSHWAYAYIESAAADGIVNGVGNGLYSPNKELTLGEYLAIMVRAFYPDEMAVKEGKLKADNVQLEWYTTCCTVAFEKGLTQNISTEAALQNAIGLLTGPRNSHSEDLAIVSAMPAYRADMAVIAVNIMLDKGLPELSADMLLETRNRIPDLNSAISQQNLIAYAYYHGVLTGVDELGTFNPMGTVDRATAATIYCRLRDIVDTYGDGDRQTTAPTSTKKAPYATTEDSIVGTVSDSRVMLSLSTHTAPVDYYSRHPELNGIVDKDDYNAYVFTALNREWYVENGIIASYWGKLDDGTHGWTYGIDTFNYPCFDRKSELGLSATLPFTNYYISSITNGGMHINRVGDVDSDNIGVYKVTKRNLEDIYNGAFVPIFAKFTDDMNDKEKIVIMVEALCDKMTYADGSPELEDIPYASGSEVWTSTAPLSRGVCDDYALAFASICQAAGIPCINTGGQVAANINHAWNLVYADGEWLMVDVTAVDTGGFAPYYTKEEGVKILGNDNGDFDCQAQLIIEALCKDIYG